MSWSLILPGVGAAHFNGIFPAGWSKFSGGNVFHYQGKRYVGKSIRNSFGEPNHYGRSGSPVGYSRRLRRTKLVHYSRRGKPVGWSRYLFFVSIHKGSIARNQCGFFLPDKTRI